MKLNQNKDLHLGMSIGLVCLTEEGSTIGCSLCASQTEFSKVLNFLCHIRKEHGFTSGTEIDYTGQLKLQEYKEYGSNREKTHPKYYLQRMDVSMEATPESSSLKKTQQELGNEISMKIVENENVVEISSKEFYCLHCKTNFLSGKDIMKHICSKIPQTFTDTVKMENQSLNELKYKCEICNKTFTTLRGFGNHKTRIHQKTHTNTNFSLKSELLKHKCSNDKSSYVDLVEAEVGTAVIKNNNRIDEPSSEKTLSCPHCPATLKSVGTLRYHLLRHSAQKTFKCDYCSGSYYTPSKLREHLKISHAASFRKVFGCAICSAIFKSQQSLNLHILKHKGEKPFKCEHCSRAFYLSCSLKRHNVTHSEKKPFKCEHCSSVFNRSDLLKTHMVTHSEKKPYKCEQCSSAFYRKDRLKAHMLIHSVNKTLKCEQCSRAFYRLDSLKRHILSHSGKKPYSCEHCLSSFKTCDKLKLHMEKHTENEITKVETA